jgi:hypothetical protein
MSAEPRRESSVTLEIVDAAISTPNEKTRRTTHTGFQTTVT